MSKYEVRGLPLSPPNKAKYSQSCYIFSPDEADIVPQLPWKRRRIEPARAPDDQNPELLFTPLFRGVEKTESTRIRFEVFQRCWCPKETSLKVHGSPH